MIARIKNENCHKRAQGTANGQEVKIRNQKLEIRNKFEKAKSERLKTASANWFSTLALRISGFGFRILILSALVLVGCAQKEKDEAKAPAAEKSAEPESHVKHGTNGETIVTFDAATQKLMGLQTTALQAAQLTPELKGYGRVLDVAPLTSLVADLMAAQAASAASQAELARLKTLAAQNNASERSLQAAEAAAARDRSQVESMRLRLLSAWGQAIAQRPDLPAFVQSLSSLTSALVQLDLPAGQPLSSLPTGARLLALADETKAVPAEFVSPAPTVDPQMQGRGFLFLLTTNSSHLAPGAAVSGFLELPGEAQSGVELPRSAIVRFNGTTWVYLQQSEEAFERREVKLDSFLSEGWFVRERVKPGDRVVTVGAQQLLSEELKGQAGE
jgi:hypothetical protein